MGEVHVDRCNRCEALWFDRTELAAALAHHAPGLPVDWGIPLPKASPREQLSCPRDSQGLVRYEWLGVNLARCPACHGILYTSPDWQALLSAVDARLQGKGQRSAAWDVIEVVLTILGSGF